MSGTVRRWRYESESDRLPAPKRLPVEWEKPPSKQ